MKKTIYLILLSFVLPLCFEGLTLQRLNAAPTNIPLKGNAYATKEKSGVRITGNGIEKWTNPETIVSCWFKISKPGFMNLSLRAKTPEKGSIIKVTVNNESFDVFIDSPEWNIIPVADDLEVSDGYLQIDLQGMSKKGDIFAEISDIVIDGNITAEPIYSVKDFSPYWGRRGPSVHMGYALPQDKDIEYFYNEVTVPKGQDVIGSYYMANGFGEGYFGMQVNSDKERRILFSVWSPFVTDDPKEIPDDHKIINLRRGKDVHIGEFGNEGSGGQSYLKYPWKAGNTYKFLSQVKPDGKGNTVYTGYFFAPEEGKWKLISSFKRPNTNTWYKRPHSFLENFSPDQGYITRNVQFGNQWAVTKDGKWIELNQGNFTHDATGAAKARMDYAGGVDEKTNKFYLQNCGFFDDNTPYNSKFERKKENKKPKINFKQLENLKK